MATSRRAATKPSRRSPISREEGERRLIAAATSLLQSKPFPSVTIRELASAADVHQNYIHSWFGSQNGLYMRVLGEVLTQFINAVGEQPVDVIPIDPNSQQAQFAARLMLWLDLEGCDLSSMKPTIDLLVEATNHRLTNVVGLKPSVADVAAPHVAVFFMGMASFGHLFGVDPAQVHKVGTSWLQQVASQPKGSSGDTK
jgi:AcrR family transcriptional regulator